MILEARFIPTAEDHVTAYRMHKREGKVARNLYPVAGAALAILFWVIAHFSQRWNMAVAGTILGIITGILPFYVEWRLRRVARKVKAEEVRYRFTDEGIEFWGKFGQAKHTWDLVMKASLDDRGLLLYSGPYSYSFVPARAFSSGYFPREELKAFLRAKLRTA